MNTESNASMNTNNLNLIFCSQNESEINSLIGCLIKNDYSVSKIKCSDPDFADSIQLMNGPGIACISDNYLKSKKCLTESSKLIINLIKVNKILPVIIRGRYSDTSSACSYKLVETYIDRKEDYLNYWSGENITIIDIAKEFIDFIQSSNYLKCSGKREELQDVLEGVKRLDFSQEFDIEAIKKEILVDIKNSNNPLEALEIFEKQADQKIFNMKNLFYNKKLNELRLELEKRNEEFDKMESDFQIELVAREKRIEDMERLHKEEIQEEARRIATRLIRERDEQIEQERLAEEARIAEKKRMEDELRERLLEEIRAEKLSEQEAEEARIAEKRRMEDELRKEFLAEIQAKEKLGNAGKEVPSWDNQKENEGNGSGDFEERIASKLNSIRILTNKYAQTVNDKRNQDNWDEYFKNTTESEEQKNDDDGDFLLLDNIN